MRHCVPGLVIVCLFACSARADVLALWNFNDAASGVEFALLVDRGAGTMTTDFGAGDIGSMPGTSINGQDGDIGGSALRLVGNANNGRNLTWMVSTDGFESIGISFAALRTNSGFSSNQLQYTTDGGTNWAPIGLLDISSAYALHSWDLGAIGHLADNPLAGFRVVLGGATAWNGSVRFDNLLVTGDRMPEQPPPPAAPVPEPSSLTLTLLGLAAAGKFLPLGRNRQR
jgi:hypothetical protein